MTKRRRIHQIPAWMAAYYANSVGGLVIADYESGNVTRMPDPTRESVITRDRTDAGRAAELRAEIEEMLRCDSISKRAGLGPTFTAQIKAKRAELRRIGQ